MLKCIFNFWRCDGNLKESPYTVPFKYYFWPIIYRCEYHKDHDFDWKDALNSRSNVSNNNIKMTHTKELSALQSLDFWFGRCDEIVFCSECKGIGGIADILSPVGFRPCEKCKCTGREINGNLL